MASAFVAKEYKAFNYFCCIVSLLFLSASIGHAGSILTYQGRILKSDGSPVKTSTSFTISITNPSGNCILWAEPFSSSMSSGDGSFSFTIGAGTRSDAGTKEFKDIFSDGVVISPNSSCPAGYTKLSSDILKLKVSFNDGTGAQSLPAMDITAVPFAIEAQKVAGVASENVLRVSDGVAAPLSSTNFSELMALLNGTSSHYSKNNQLKGMTVPTLSEGQVLGWSGGAWAPLTPSGSGLSAVTANAPLSVDSSTASSPKISLSKADASTNGYLSKEDWATFNQKQSKSLAQGNLWVGDSTNTAAAVLPGGDVSMADDGTFSVLKIRQNPVASGTISALDIGKVYRWNGTQLVPSFLNFGDLKTSAGANQLTAACAANQKIQWSVITDTFTCENIGSLNASAITDGTLDSARLPANATRWQDGSSGAVYYNGGNVGIGTGAAPAAKLEISGSSGSTLKIVDGNQGEGKVLTSDSGGQARWTPQAGVWATSVKTTDYTVVSTDKNTFFISNAGMTYTLLSSATAGAGYMVGFKNNAGTGAVTLNPAASESINGKSSYSLAPNGENVVLISDGVNWHSISQSRLKVCLRSTRAFEAMTFNSGGAFPSGLTISYQMIGGAGGSGWSSGSNGTLQTGTFTVHDGDQIKYYVGGGGGGGVYQYTSAGTAGGGGSGGSGWFGGGGGGSGCGGGSGVYCSGGGGGGSSAIVVNGSAIAVANGGNGGASQLAGTGGGGGSTSGGAAASGGTAGGAQYGGYGATSSSGSGAWNSSGSAGALGGTGSSTYPGGGGGGGYGSGGGGGGSNLCSTPVFGGGNGGSSGGSGSNSILNSSCNSTLGFGGLGVNSYPPPVTLSVDPNAGKGQSSTFGGNAGQIVIQYSVPDGVSCSW